MGKHRLLFPLDLFVLLFLVGALLGVEFSYDPALSGTVQRGIIVGVIVYFGLAHGIWGWGMAYGAGILLMLAGTIYAAFFILQFSYQNYPETPAIIEQIGQMTTLLPDQGVSPGHPNAAATFFVSLIPLGAAVVFTRRSWLFKIFWALCTFICLYALVLTFSRGAMVALVAATFIGMIALGRNPLLRIIGVFGIAAGIALVLSSSATIPRTRWDSCLLIV